MRKDNDFYRYIYKDKKGYSIIKNNQFYLYDRNLTTVLYERDRLEQSGWDWDVFVTLPDTVNHYLCIELPPFEHKGKFIQCTVHESWTVMVDNKPIVSFYDFKTAKEYQKSNGGWIKYCKPTYQVYKYIDGKKKYFGTFHNFQDAVNHRDYCVENDWEI